MTIAELMKKHFGHPITIERELDNERRYFVICALCHERIVEDDLDPRTDWSGEKKR